MPEHFLSALAWGALGGGVLTPLWLSWPGGLLPPYMFVATIPCAALIWLVGLVGVGLPAWFVLHRLCVRSPIAAAILGGTVLLPAFLQGSHDVQGLVKAASFVAIGAVVGLVVWLRSYGTAPS